MGLLGYSFINLTKEQVHDRRVLLDRYALIAQWSVVVLLFAFQLHHLLSWLSRRCGQNDEEETPSSPYLKAEAENNKTSSIRSIQRRVAKVSWYLGDEIIAGFGTKAEWLYGALWTIWLLTLCIMDTGNDYMHLTKRFGIVAASQLPWHYLLAMKSHFSPLQLLTRMSHEQLNSVHRVLGKVIAGLLTLHAIFYLNFFIRVSVLSKRIKDRDVILGLVCIIIITTISTSAAAVVRKWSYRLFYALHAVLATVFLPLAFFHVHHIRTYIVESAAIYVVHLLLRFMSRKTYNGSIALIPDTSLIQVKIAVPKSGQTVRPGQHVYLSMPDGYRGTSIPSVFLQNPFTIASLPRKDGELVLAARVLGGSTKALAERARADSIRDPGTTSVPLKIEGPYGAAAFLPDLGTFDRVLLVAGGVGATFVLPLWRNLLELAHANNHRSPSDLRLVWAVRSLSEMSWALPFPEAELYRGGSQERPEAEVYITGVTKGLSSGEAHNEGMELAETEALVNDEDEKHVLQQGITVKRGRPDLHSLTTEICSGHTGRIAILACGPESMLKMLRHNVKKQVRKGKNIHWHAEEFGL